MVSAKVQPMLQLIISKSVRHQHQLAPLFFKVSIKVQVQLSPPRIISRIMCSLLNRVFAIRI